jgi:hypothetical protein
MRFIRVPHWSSSVALAAALLVSTAAFAGEVKFGSSALATDDKGIITPDGKKSATNEIPSHPGEELWPLHVWAKIDKGAPGPLYVEFHGRLADGKRYLAYRYEHQPYEGEKYVTMALELSGNEGFNKNRAYEVELTQVGPKGPIKLATGKITLGFTEAPESDEPDDDDYEDDDDFGSDDQAEADTFAGGEGGDEGPPPVEPSKKGCAIDASGHAAPGVLVLFALAVGRGRRRR